jgi:hypothetical protein
MLTSCLAALESQRDGAEVLVCEAQPSPPELRERFRWARYLERPGELVPVLWSDGIDAARAPIVALTISPMVPGPDWVETVRREHRERDVVAGAIEPGERLRISDWAEYFCRYAADMLPFDGHESPDLPGDNASYKRELLEEARGLYRDGFWEPTVHQHLAGQGVVLWHAPELVVRQGRSAGVRAFVRQRLVHGRAYGRQRGAGFSRGRNVLGAIAAPAVPILLTLRILRQVTRRRRLRLRALYALPAILLFNVAWAAGEARGHLEALRVR